MFHLSAAPIPLPVLGCTSCWLPVPFPGQTLFWFSPPLAVVFPLHHFQHRMLLPLASASSSSWLSFLGPPFTKTGSQLVFPHWRKSTQHSSWVRFQIPIANSQSPSVTRKGAQQTSFQLPARKHAQEYSPFLSIAPPLLPPYTEIIYPSIFPWEKTNQPEPCDFPKAIIDYLAVATRNVLRKLVLLNAPGRTQRFVLLAGLQFAFVLPKCKLAAGPAENTPVTPTL